MVIGNAPAPLVARSTATGNTQVRMQKSKSEARAMFLKLPGAGLTGSYLR
jgi:hypothetical protein